MKVRVSDSVRNFKEKVIKEWKIQEWEGINDPDKELLFFGMYLQLDYDIYQRFNGKKYVFWGGSDLQRLVNNYSWQRILKLYPDTEHYVENEVEYEELKSCGIESKIVPSFLENVNDFEISYKQSDNPHIWLCSHPGRDEEYGVYLMEEIAPEFPNYTFHIYGVDGETHDNVIFHGKVTQEQFNEEIKGYQCGIRPNVHDGNSEVTMKSMLMGQYPISRIKYSNMWHYETIDELKELLKKLPTMKEPNNARVEWVKILNNYPFNYAKR